MHKFSLRIQLIRKERFFVLNLLHTLRKFNYIKKSLYSLQLNFHFIKKKKQMHFYRQKKKLNYKKLKHNKKNRNIILIIVAKKT